MPPLLTIFFPLFLLPDLGFQVVAHNCIGFGGVRGGSLVVLWGVDDSVNLTVLR